MNKIEFPKDFLWGVATAAYQIDYETQQRIPKDSALWYRDMIAASL